MAVRASCLFVGISGVLFWGLGCASADGASDGSVDSGAGVSRESSDGSLSAIALPGNDAPGDEAGVPDGDATNPGEAGGFGAGSDSSSPGDSGLWASVSKSGPPAWSGPAVSGSVTVVQAKVVGRLADGFVGLSYEKSHITDPFFTGSNSALIAMCRLLGPSVVRIGGNSVDKTQWQPSAPPAAVSALSSSIGTADVDGLADFLKATGWKVIYGLNLKTATPQSDAAEATYAAGRLGTSLYAFEIGNEPDLYGQTYAVWSANWGAVATAVRGALAGVPLAGPATAGGGVSEAVELAHDEASRLALLTQHYYRGSGNTTTATDVVMSQLLSPDPKLVSTLGQLSTAVTSNNLTDGFRVAEANSFFAHGAPGVSNAFGSALWAIDFLFDNAENGSGGVNFHGGGVGQDGASPFMYTPIDEVNGVVTGAAPIFYGMLLVASAGTGNVLATMADASNLNFTAYAISLPDGSTNVVLNNKDTTKAVQASVNIGKAATAASGVFLNGPSLLATSGVTFAGAAIPPGGGWSPAPAWTLPVTGNVVSILVPPASGALVHVR